MADLMHSATVDALRAREWYILRVSPAYLMETRSHGIDGGYERRAVKWLDAMGLNPFVPLHPRWQRRSKYSMQKDMERKTVPLLPGYVLISPDCECQPFVDSMCRINWYAVKERTKPWCYGIVAIDGRPIMVAGDDVRDRERVSLADMPSLPRGLTYVFDAHKDMPLPEQMHMLTNQVFSVGDAVEVTDNVLGVLPAVVDSIDGAVTTVRAPFFGSERIMQVETHKLVRRLSNT